MPSEPSERNGAVAGVVLAAGSSTRMGQNKLFFELDGATLLRRVVRCALDGGLDPVIVVVGHEAERARAELAELACTPVDNPDHALGINRSLRTGISHVPECATAAVVMLADMPFVTSRMIESLVARYRESTVPLVISTYGAVNAPPMLYDRALFSELRQMKGEGCGRQVVRRHRDEALSVSWPEAALRDIDVPEDYARIRAELGVGDGGDDAAADDAAPRIGGAGNGAGTDDAGPARG
ncbi:MAG: nucleotidyltransferase family protein [Acidobacteria bacterium]|nr:nucleotidyltransferase family protein [Acidobacteriota bacterium]